MAKEKENPIEKPEKAPKEGPGKLPKEIPDIPEERPDMTPDFSDSKQPEISRNNTQNRSNHEPMGPGTSGPMNYY